MRVLKDEGDRVAQGTVLAVLDDTDFRLARDRAKAALDVAEANRAHAQGGRGSRRQPAEDRRHHRQGSPGRAGGRSGGRSVRRAGAHRAGDCRTAARAHAGQGAACRAHRQASADAGTMLAVGRPIFEIVDDGVFEFRASVASADFAKVRVGEAVTVTVDALPGFSDRGAGRPHRAARRGAQPLVRGGRPRSRAGRSSSPACSPARTSTCATCRAA